MRATHTRHSHEVRSCTEFPLKHKKSVELKIWCCSSVALIIDASMQPLKAFLSHTSHRSGVLDCPESVPVSVCELRWLFTPVDVPEAAPIETGYRGRICEAMRPQSGGSKYIEGLILNKHQGGRTHAPVPRFRMLYLKKQQELTALHPSSPHETPSDS